MNATSPGRNAVFDMLQMTPIFPHKATADDKYFIFTQEIGVIVLTPIADTARDEIIAGFLHALVPSGGGEARGWQWRSIP